MVYFTQCQRICLQGLKNKNITKIANMIVNFKLIKKPETYYTPNRSRKHSTAFFNVEKKYSLFFS